MAVKPKKTFLNLPPEKQSYFLKRSFTEFALYDYQQASVSQIVNDLGIAKGSVYQYFENKKELYLFLVDLARRRRNEFLKVLYEKETDDYLEWFGLLLWQELLFMTKAPIQALLLENVARERFHPDLGNLALDHRRSAMEIHEAYIVDQQARGKMAKDLNVHMTAHLLHSVHQQLAIFFQGRYGFSLLELVKTGETGSLPKKKVLKKDIGSLLNLLSKGLHR